MTYVSKKPEPLCQGGLCKNRAVCTDNGVKLCIRCFTAKWREEKRKKEAKSQ